MAIAFARARYLSRRTGGNAVRTAAYNARRQIRSERTRETFCFATRDGLTHHAVLLPDGADPGLADPAALWNRAETAERRSDAQVARELVLALPHEPELQHSDRVALATRFAHEQFVAKGLAVQLDLHGPEDDESNPHAHLLVTTRRVEGNRLAARKARDLEPQLRTARGRPIVTEADSWGEVWRETQNRYFLEQGLALRVDANAIISAPHLGPMRFRSRRSDLSAEQRALGSANRRAAHDPDQVLGALTRTDATFSTADLRRFLGKYLDNPADAAAVERAVLCSPELVRLADPATGRPSPRMTTRTVRAEEQAALAAAEILVLRQGHAIPVPVAEGEPLRPEQRRAAAYLAGGGDLRLLEGPAGTGKGLVLERVRQGYQATGCPVIGLAPTHAVVQELRACGFEAQTVHSQLFRLKNGRAAWTPRTVVVVDEAPMLSTPVLRDLLEEARAAGAKLILAGDSGQFAAIERGGLFPELAHRLGAARLTGIVRQHAAWQRVASEDLAAGRVGEALRAYRRYGAVHWRDGLDRAQDALVRAWAADARRFPGESRFVFAYTNREVDRLNERLRAVRRAQGQLGPDRVLATRHGPAAFAVGDRVQITRTDKTLGLANGSTGFISDLKGGRVTVRLDNAVEVTWSVGTFDGFRHGYAGTLHRGQGLTVDRTYLLHSRHWRTRAGYVALTRHRVWTRVFAARDQAPGLEALTRQLARADLKQASVAYAVAGVSRVAAPGPQKVSEPGFGTTIEASPRAAARNAERDAWLVAPRPDAAARRDVVLVAERIRAAVDADTQVVAARQELGVYLSVAYRDPAAAWSRLRALADRDGWTSLAARVRAEPTTLGPLRGLDGWFGRLLDGGARDRAVLLVRSVADGLERLRRQEGRAETDHCRAAQTRFKAESTGVPRLSPAAEAAVARLEQARTVSTKARADAWRTLLNDRPVAAELARFRRAARVRFGGQAGVLVAGGSGVSHGDDQGAVATPRIAQIYDALLVCQTSARSERQAVELSLHQSPRLRPRVHR
ncbi:MAG TPA: AAA family ATPase [Azospirillaceae bacterium]|nr:AAA family ATPase [Azospirillaceae bacterium]